MEFVFSKKTKTLSYVLIAIGVIAAAYGFISDTTPQQGRFWSNLLVNGFFLFAVGLGSLFFLSLQYATEAGWSMMVKRIFEGIMSVIPVAAGILLVVFLVGSFGGHSIYEWMNPEVTNKESELFDLKIYKKSAYLNLPFFWIRTIAYIAAFIIFARYFRKMSLLQDKQGGSAIWVKNYQRGALFLVIFAVFSSTLAWDWIMSIDAHWFSTLFGWYVFSGMWCSAMIVAVMLTLYLKGKGYLPHVNQSHIHDLGKWMFALSFLWSYMWFAQFVLIWYSNIPKEVTYYIARIEDYQIPFFAMFIINFALPMLLLMSRDTKRNRYFLIIVGMIILVGHWLDVFIMVTPGVLNNQFQGFGFLEVGMFLGFVGLFINIVFSTFAKAPLEPVQDPYLEETIHHSI
ncbi:MAG: quinol:cytochrome C oxidoreductase [Luteibaculaceae bacterium]